MMKINGLSYDVLIGGKGEPVMMLHGFTGSINTWRHFVSKHNEDFRFVVPSLVGHGKTDAPHDLNRYTIESVVEDLVGILDQLKINQIHLVGYSMGGRLAIAFALKYPNRLKSLVLESASAGISSKKEREKRQESDGTLSLKIDHDGMEAFVDYWENIPLFQPLEKKISFPDKLRLRTDRISHKPNGLMASLIMMGTGSQPYYMNKLSRIKVPTLILTGKIDEKFSKIGEQMADQIINSEHVIVKDSGHVIHLEQSMIFDRIVVDFMKKVEEK
ncbi:MAG: Menaquinone biosynthesis related protein [Bacillales bacterium]|jgi:2-succinyl-6-hydroxy-2,4-cyclohexadiene-1-carboxylate synthase|nr:Menaquinone biosynthesis related protein [Bacillales bacterium]